MIHIEVYNLKKGNKTIIEYAGDWYSYLREKLILDERYRGQFIFCENKEDVEIFNIQKLVNKPINFTKKGWYDIDSGTFFASKEQHPDQFFIGETQYKFMEEL
jgi:hypothetical protein